MSGGLTRVLVVGTGLLGTSIGLALRERGVTVFLRDQDDEALATAVAREAGVADPPDSPVDVAIVAVPPDVTAQVLRGVLLEGVARAVTDVASVKSGMAAAIGDLPASSSYVGSHPMAGREVSGPLGAEATLFAARPWVVCAEPDADPQCIELVTTVALLVGATPVQMSAAQHDAAVALVSHAPHVVAALVAGQLAGADDADVRLAGPGIVDITRVAASDPSLWEQILPANAKAVRGVLVGIRDGLDRMLDALDGGDGDVIGDLLQTGVDGRSRLPGKHGGAHLDFVDLPVRLADRPGQLARLFSDVEEAGVNVEDVRIEHVPGEPVGLVELSVRPAQFVPLRDALAARGWTVPATGPDPASLGSS